MPTLDAIHFGPASKETPKQLIVLCHGLSADAYDVDLGHWALSRMHIRVGVRHSWSNWAAVVERRRSFAVGDGAGRAHGRALSARLHRRRTRADEAAARGNAPYVELAGAAIIVVRWLRRHVAAARDPRPAGLVARWPRSWTRPLRSCWCMGRLTTSCRRPGRVMPRSRCARPASPWRLTSFPASDTASTTPESVDALTCRAIFP